MGPHELLSLLSLPAVWFAAAATAVAALVLLRLAPRAGWLDAGEGVRKLQPEPVASVGGAAILIGISVAVALERVRSGAWSSLGSELAALLPRSPSGAATSLVPWGTASLLAAFAVGLWDDFAPAGLSARKKLAGQLVAGAILAVPLLSSATPATLLAALGLMLGAVAAQNALNTFDNADGAALSLASAGLFLPAPILATAPATCLPFNLRPGRPARVYLGDSGSHLLGMLLLLHPAAWGAFVLPLLDLFRLCIVRLRAGQAPWLGDRRHLAHRLQRKGFGPSGVVAAQLLIAAPALLLCASTGNLLSPASLLGILASTLLFLLAILSTEPPRRVGIPAGSSAT
jgi:UDP-GlcNAc:undecaprenyl-phosphate/decaprenyl-phosphate GlcNAc-1-phosphate transferase